jgi:hypothetical protein
MMAKAPKRPSSADDLERRVAELVLEHGVGSVAEALANVQTRLWQARSEALDVADSVLVERRPARR